MEWNNLCMGCLGEKGPADICPACGLSEADWSGPSQFLLPRTILNHRYLIGRVLGFGGFGVTYLSFDINLKIKLAIKEYLPRNLAGRAPGQAPVSIFEGEARDHFAYGLEQFIEEARALAQFNSHPSIVSVSDFFRENDTAYLVMEYIDGITFKEYLEQNGGKISYRESIEKIMPVLAALHVIHQAGMLHRDISPDNIYLAQSGQVKLLDFGAARHAVGEHSQCLSILLKPGYSPVEQYQNSSRQGPWTDVYAAAATIYRAVTGLIPPESLARMERDTLLAPSRLGVALPDELEAVLLKALSIKAQSRFQTIDEFQAALHKSIDCHDESGTLTKIVPAAHGLKIAPLNYIHPEDKAALDNLTAIPLFSTCVKEFMKIFTEKRIYGLNMAQKIRLGPRQLPEIYNQLPPVCDLLNIAEPEFYLEMNPIPNAYAHGDTQVFLTITSGLLEALEAEEIKAIIAHECGHIACRHMLYHTMASMMIQYGAKIFGPLAAMATPVWLGLLHWRRRSELSADRAAAVVMEGAGPVVNAIIRLAGGPKSITAGVNFEEYLKQADAYDRLLEESQWQMFLQGMAVLDEDHPFLAVRAREVWSWCGSEPFQRILKARQEGGTVSRCSNCGRTAGEDWTFCKYCGTKMR
jgi:serine/threonine protein kinase